MGTIFKERYFVIASFSQILFKGLFQNINTALMTNSNISIELNAPIEIIEDSIILGNLKMKND
jgi:hypothetical protein